LSQNASHFVISRQHATNRSPTSPDPAAAPGVGAGYARRLCELVERFGLPRQGLLRHAGADLAGWDPAQARIPLPALLALFRSALVLTGRRDLGLEFGRHARPDTFEVLGYALMTCRNLGEAISLVPRYRHVVFDAGYSETRLAREGNALKFSWVILPEASEAGLPYSDVLAESLIASWYGLGRWIAGADLPLREARFRHAAPEDSLPFANFFACPVRFDAGENALLFAAELLEQPLVQADAELNLAMCDEARRFIERRHGDTGIAAQVRRVLAPLMPKCEMTLRTSPAPWASRRAPCNAVSPAPTVRFRDCSTTRAANWRRCICAMPRCRRWMSPCCWAMPSKARSPAPSATGSTSPRRHGASASWRLESYPPHPRDLPCATP
jgi:hypothetical protein